MSKDYLRASIKTEKPILLIDMDGVICDFDKRANELEAIGIKGSKLFRHPEAYKGLEPIAGAIDAWIRLQEKYETYILPCNNNRTPLSRTTFKAMFSNAGYTKQLYLPQTSSQQTLKIQRACANPTYAQKPFPYAVNSNQCSGEIYIAPPEWYISEK